MSKRTIKLLTNESFLGVISLTILGGVGIYCGHIEIAGVAVGGIAAMLRGAQGEKDEENKQ